MSWFEAFYPDVRHAGGLHAALRERLQPDVLDPIDGEPGRTGRGGLYEAAASAGERSIGASLGIEHRVFVGEFWEAGVCLGGYAADSLPEVASLFERWVVRGEPASRLAAGATAEVRLRPWAVAHESGTAAYVEFHWRELVRASRSPRLSRLARAAAEIPALRGLLPYTGHEVLHFSRCTGYPFSYDCPSITPLGGGRCSVASAAGTVLGTGSAREAALLAAAHLPPGCGPARRGAWTE
jgi:hypothetical protein